MSDPRLATVGDLIPSFTRDSSFAAWNRFAAVNDEFIPLHMDDAAGQASGYPGAIGMGRLQWSYLHNLLRDWLGDHGHITAMTVQYRAPQLRDGSVTARGRITAVGEAEEGRILELQIWVEDASGQVLSPGTATVTVDSRMPAAEAE